ncbi:MAG: hypothetical protein ACE14U_04160 [Candidatus Velamenicoccus archaeovorus]
MEKSELEEIKGTTLEEVDRAAVDGRAGVLEGIIKRAADEIKKIRDAAHERAWLATPEGKAWKKRQAEEAKLEAVYQKQVEEIYAAKVLLAKRALVLERLADDLLKTAKIDNNDLRLAQIMGEQDRLRAVVAAAYQAR